MHVQLSHGVVLYRMCGNAYVHQLKHHTQSIWMQSHYNCFLAECYQCAVVTEQGWGEHLRVHQGQAIYQSNLGGCLGHLSLPITMGDSVGGGGREGEWGCRIRLQGSGLGPTLGFTSQSWDSGAVWGRGFCSTSLWKLDRAFISCFKQDVKTKTF